MRYGTLSTKYGWNALCVSVNEYTVPLPLTGSGLRSIDWQLRHTGLGKCTQ